MTTTRDKLREALAAQLHDAFAPGRRPTRPRDGGRVFTDSEQVVLTPDARQYLMRLLGAGQLDRLQLELIVHYVSTYWHAPVGVRDLVDLLDQVVFGLEPPDPDEPPEMPPNRPH